MRRLITMILLMGAIVSMATAPVHSTAQRRPVLSAATLDRSAAARPAVVVIDAGHGGKDPGASGPMRIHEKNVVLAIAKDFQQDLNQFALVKVSMTRSGDYFVTLRGRLSVARNDHADIFVAVHADSYINKRAHGASVFALSEHGATSEAAHWLARSENYAVLGGANFDHRSRSVQSLLLKLSQTVTIEDSLTYGTSIARQLAQIIDMHSRHVDQAPFMVLKNPDIPSILVETGFISNANEEKRLNDPAYQQKIAQALALGTIHYLYANPPHDSAIWLQQEGLLVEKVRAEETLTTVAARYCTTPERIKAMNHLASNQVHPGEVLKIPAVEV